jgi:hypothetical protein
MSMFSSASKLFHAKRGNKNLSTMVPLSIHLVLTGAEDGHSQKQFSGMFGMYLNTLPKNILFVIQLGPLVIMFVCGKHLWLPRYEKFISHSNLIRHRESGIALFAKRSNRLVKGQHKSYAFQNRFIASSSQNHSVNRANTFVDWTTPQCPPKYWDDASNQRKFMNWASNQLNIKEMSDWYKISFKVNKKLSFQLKLKDLHKIGGLGMLYKYNYSHSLLLSSVYSDYNWLPWKFEHCPRNFWDKASNQRQFLDWAGKQLQIKDMNDWYKISKKVARQFFQVET